MRATSPQNLPINDLSDTVWIRPLTYTDALGLNYGDLVFLADDGTATPGHIKIRYRDSESDPATKIRDVKVRRGGSFTSDVVGHYAEFSVRSMFGTEITALVFSSQDAIDAAGSSNASLTAKRVFMPATPDDEGAFEAPVTPVRHMVGTITLTISDIGMNDDPEAIMAALESAIAAALPANVTIDSARARKVADKHVDVFTIINGQRTQVARGVRRDLAHQFSKGGSFESIAVPPDLVNAPFHPLLQD